ncbi:GFA family protein [Phenylobacterium sp.]|jgi:hypothetical protein|uniref:GFA family protein n=1 Tax=Phenylobacterium sp. TaxID=1871053 RepID=UPI002F931A17
MSVTGGCQCGAVRYEADSLGASSICHCRMCQKATGGFFGPYVDTPGLTWTRGQPKYFASSQSVRRGFCEACGTPLTFESHGESGVMIGTLDDPERAPPTTQLDFPEKLSFVDRLGELRPWKSKAGLSAAEAFKDVASNQAG